MQTLAREIAHSPSQAGAFPVEAVPRYRPIRRQRAELRIPVVFILIGFLGVAGFFHAYQQALVAQNNIDISRLNAEIEKEINSGKDLKIQKMLLQSPARVERVATTRLKMVRPENVTYIVVPGHKDQPKTDMGDSAKKGRFNGALAKISPLTAR